MLFTPLLHRLTMPFTTRDIPDLIRISITVLLAILTAIGTVGWYLMGELKEVRNFETMATERQMAFEVRFVERQAKTEEQIRFLHLRMDETIAVLADRTKTLENRMNEPKIRQ